MTIELLPFELTPLNVLATLGLSLMVAVTAGVIYLTAVEWRDRRRQERERRGR
jgi:hypothetical protein